MSDLRVITLDGSENVIEDTVLQEFRNGLEISHALIVLSISIIKIVWVQHTMPS